MRRAPRHGRSWVPQVLIALVLVLAALVVVITTSGNSSARASGRWIGSMFQDDNHLVYASTATVTRTLNALKRLGVGQIRSTVLWKAIAPDPLSRTRPAGFHPVWPGDYPAANWAPYDRLVALAQARGIRVNFDITAPGPLWANRRGAPSTRYADHWYASGAQFGQFVQAVAKRYSGRYKPPGATSALPRVSFWSIWNEPNQPGWLSPQWRSASGPVMEAPVLYRAYVDAAFRALLRTGHRPSTDTILIGELAPEGCVPGVPCIYPRTDWPIPPLPFLRAVYCLSPTYQPLRGRAATALACPPSGDVHSFVASNPALFQASGFAHHPYSFFQAPNVTLPTRSFAPLSNLSRLEQTLDSIFRADHVSRRLPLYLTEYGYETNPPNPYRGVSLKLQSLYLNEAQYLAWRDPRVVSLSQFLLYDSPPDTKYPKGSFSYWRTFQTGLLFADGRVKPSLEAYRLPIFLPDPVLKPGRPLLVWALLRTAPPGSSQHAQIQWRSTGGSTFRTLQTVSTHSEDLAAMVKVPGPGSVRVQWRSPSGETQYSRAAFVKAG